MKRFLLVFLIFTALILRGSAQVTLTLTPQIVNTAVVPDSFETKGKATLRNTSTATKRFLWQRNIVAATNGWQVLVCDANQCWTSTTSGGCCPTWHTPELRVGGKGGGGGKGSGLPLLY